MKETEYLIYEEDDSYPCPVSDGDLLVAEYMDNPPKQLLLANFAEVEYLREDFAGYYKRYLEEQEDNEWSIILEKLEEDFPNDAQLELITLTDTNVGAYSVYYLFCYDNRVFS